MGYRHADKHTNIWKQTDTHPARNRCRKTHRKKTDRHIYTYSHTLTADVFSPLLWKEMAVLSLDIVPEAMVRL